MRSRSADSVAITSTRFSKCANLVKTCCRHLEPEFQAHVESSRDPFLRSTDYGMFAELVICRLNSAACNNTSRTVLVGAGEEEQKHIQQVQNLEQKLRETEQQVKDGEEKLVQTEESLKNVESERDTAMECTK